MSESVLDRVTAALAEATPDAVSMPITDVLDAEVPLGGVAAFGLSGDVGQRRFRTGVEITAGANPIEVRAMFRGLLTEFGFGSSLDFPGADLQGLSADRLEAGAWYYVPRSPALVLRVSALGPLRAAIAGPRGATVETGHRAWRHPIELPPPAWVVYEGVGLQVSPEVSVARRETFDRLPVDFPAEGQSWGDWGGGVPTEEVTDLLDGYEERLRDLVELLLADHTLRAYVVGHTDSTAREQHNQALSERRTRMFAARMQEIAQAFAGTSLDEYQLNLAWKGERQLRYRSDADHPDQRALNRRVEIVVAAAEDLEVTAGQVIGSCTGTLRVTVLDETGRFLDPLDVVRRYDQDGRFATHVLTGHRDPLAPAIASGWVHCVTPAGTTGDGASDPQAARYFAFLPLDPADENPLVTILQGTQLGGVQPADVVWLAGIPSVHATLTLATPITLVGTGAPGGLVAVFPADSSRPIVTIEDTDPSGIGFRVLGLFMLNGRSGDGGGAVRLEGPESVAPADVDRRAQGGERPGRPQNVHIAGCHFSSNHAPGASGGAIHVSQCANVLVEDCRFQNNDADEGGALFATRSANVVVGGRPLPPSDEAAFAILVLDPDPATTLGPSELDLNEFRCRFQGNVAEGSGGALAFEASTFEVAGCAFQENTANGDTGGAIVTRLDEPGLLAEAKAALARGEPDALPRARSRITHCLARTNTAATSGGAFALLGGGVCLIRENIVFQNIAQEGRGGGLFLATAVAHCWRSRLEANYAHASGGGLACVAQAHARLVQTLILHNGSQAPGPLPVEDGLAFWTPHHGGTRGGGGLDARGFSADDRTTVWLAGGNWLLENQSDADGGGVLAVSGARVVCGWTSPDLFDGNVAQWSGGGMAVRNADLDVHAGVQFVSNEARRGYGGGLFFGGTTMYGGVPSALALETDVQAGVLIDLPSARGARLTIQGTTAAPVGFASNQAGHGDIDGRDIGGVGAALCIAQQPAPPIPESPLLSAVTERLVRRSIGLVRRVSVRGVRCEQNESDDGVAGRSVAIVVQGLEHDWIAAYDLYLRLEIARDSWIGRAPSGDYDLGPYEIRDVTFGSESGDGVWFVDSIGRVQFSGVPADRVVDHSPPVPLHP